MPVRRVRFATIAEFGLGLLVAVAVGIPLYVSGIAGVRNTQALLAERAEGLLDALERRIDSQLEPVGEQARWISRAYAEGRIDRERLDRLDAFMFGALGATPQVASLGIVDALGAARRWTRESRDAITEDWSARPFVVDFVARGSEQRGAVWGPPLWAQTGRVAVLLHGTPLRRDGRFEGMLGQTVPVARLSAELAVFGAEQDATPFILLGADRVLAHPRLAGAWPGEDRSDPLPRLADVGDAVLPRIHSPDVTSPFGMRALSGAKAVTARIGDDQYLYIYRDLSSFGREPWTLGAYLKIGGSAGISEMRRVVQSLIAGLGVLVVAVLLAAYAGRRLSRPVQSIALAARTVAAGHLDDVRQLPRSAIVEFDDASQSFNQMVDGLRERSLIRATLGRFVSEEVARGLLSGGGHLEPVEAEATVLFCDIEGFTPLTETLGPAGVVEFLNAYFEVMAAIIERHRGVITQFQGDAILAVFNVPIRDPDHAGNALRAAIEMVGATDEQAFAGVRARNRIGICTGALVAGAVGSRGRLTYTVHGNVVNMAARLEALNKDYATRILVAGASAARCADVGLRKVADAELRGYSAPVSLFTPAAGE